MQDWSQTHAHSTRTPVTHTHTLEHMFSTTVFILFTFVWLFKQPKKQNAFVTKFAAWENYIGAVGTKRYSGYLKVSGHGAAEVALLRIFMQRGIHPVLLFYIIRKSGPTKGKNFIRLQWAHGVLDFHIVVSTKTQVNCCRCCACKYIW